MFQLFNLCLQYLKAKTADVNNSEDKGKSTTADNNFNYKELFNKGGREF